MNKQLGFTLIELMIVVSIIGILATNAVSSHGNAKNIQIAKVGQIMSDRAQSLIRHDEFISGYSDIDPNDPSGYNTDHFYPGQMILVGDSPSDVTNLRRFFGMSGSMFGALEPDGSKRYWSYANASSPT